MSRTERIRWITSCAACVIFEGPTLRYAVWWKQPSYRHYRFCIYKKASAGRWRLPGTMITIRRFWGMKRTDCWNKHSKTAHQLGKKRNTSHAPASKPGTKRGCGDGQPEKVPVCTQLTDEKTTGLQPTIHTNCGDRKPAVLYTRQTGLFIPMILTELDQPLIIIDKTLLTCSSAISVTGFISQLKVISDQYLPLFPQMNIGPPFGARPFGEHLSRQLFRAPTPPPPLAKPQLPFPTQHFMVKPQTCLPYPKGYCPGYIYSIYLHVCTNRLETTINVYNRVLTQ